MKRMLRFIFGIIIFIISFILIDGLCAIYMNTRPLFAYKDNIFRSDGVIDGVVYKSLFADVYYCNTVIESYDDKGIGIIDERVLRYYKTKGEDFVCDTYIDLRYEVYDPYREDAMEHRDILYMKYDAEGLYKSNYAPYSYNSKLNVFTHNYLGDYYVDPEYYNVYMFNVSDFSLEPIKLEIDGFDLTWRTIGDIRYSSTGNIMAFEYFCGYRSEQWMGEQKYTEEDCIKNSDENGIYVFGVNDINDYTMVGYFPYDRNIYMDLYKDSYFHIYDVIDDENIIIKYIITNNKQEEPAYEIYYKWNIIDDSLVEWQV